MNTAYEEVLSILRDCKEERLIVWTKERGVGIDERDAEWLEDVFHGKTWREVQIPDKDSVVENLFSLPVSVLPSALPAILMFCCEFEEHRGVAWDLLDHKRRYCACPSGWDLDVVRALEMYLSLAEDGSDIRPIMSWIRNQEGPSMSARRSFQGCSLVFAVLCAAGCCLSLLGA